MENLVFNYFMLIKIFFGLGSLNRFKDENLLGKKVLIVIFVGMFMKKYGYLDRFIVILKEKGIEYIVFDKILLNFIKKYVMEGVKLVKEESCDFVIGFGGGSSIDFVKSIVLMVKYDGDYWDYIVGGIGKGKMLINGVFLIVVIIIIVGIGIEVDLWIVIINEEINEKIGYGN